MTSVPNENEQVRQEAQQQQQLPLTDGLMVLFLLASFTFMFGKLEGFSCETKELLSSSTWVRHTFGLSGLFAVLVIFTRARPVVSPPRLVAATFGLYAAFLVACRCDARFLAVVLAGVVGVLYLEAERCWRHKRAAEGDASDASAETQARIESAQKVIEVGVLVVAALGCLAYIGQHSREYRGTQWSWTAFWLGSPTCKGDGSPCDAGGCSLALDLYDGTRRLAGLEAAAAAPAASARSRRRK